MRTSYNRGNQEPKPVQKKPVGQTQVIRPQEPVKQPDKPVVKEKPKVQQLVENAYLDIDEELNRIQQEEMIEYEEGLNNQLGDISVNSEGTQNFGTASRSPNNKVKPNENVTEQNTQPKQKKSKTGLIIGISVASVLLVGALAFGGYKILSSKREAGSITTQISRLYSSEDKTDIKKGISQSDLDKYYMTLIEEQKRGNDVDSSITELDTIGYFLSDKETLEEYNSKSYDLTTAGLLDELESIKQNTNKYSVAGLAVTINNLSSKIKEDYDSFIKLRTELNGIMDVLNYDATSYEKAIKEVSHSPNRMELEAIHSKLLVDKKAAEAQEELKEAATEEAKKQAEEALQQAQELQKKTQEELEATKKKLEEQAGKAAEQLKDKMNGFFEKEEVTTEE